MTHQCIPVFLLAITVWSALVLKAPVARPVAPRPGAYSQRCNLVACPTESGVFSQRPPHHTRLQVNQFVPNYLQA